MNKKFLLVALLPILLSGCGGADQSTTPTNETPVVDPKKDDDQKQDEQGGGQQEQGGNQQEQGGDQQQDQKSEEEKQKEEDAKLLAANKTAAINKLDEIVYPVIAKIKNTDLKASVQSFYDQEKLYVNALVDKELAKQAATKIVDDTKAFVKDTLKPLAIEKINGVINPLIQEITNAELKSDVQDFYDTEIAKVSAIDSLSDLSDFYDDIIDDTKEFIKDETEKAIIALKNKTIQELDPYVTALIAKIPFDSLKNDTQTFYNTEKQKLEAVKTFEGFAPCAAEIKDDLEAYVLSEAKKIALAQLKEIVDAGLAKIPNPDIKSDLTTFSTTEIGKLNAITKIEDVSGTLTTVLNETKDHIKTLLGNTVKDYISRLTAIETATAYDYLPAAMKPGYSANVVDSSAIAYDFTSSTAVSNINKSGFGEQWQMVVENIDQSVMMAKVFNVAQTALNAAGNLVDIYLTNSYADEMSYSFSGDNFSGLFEFKNSVLKFNIELTESVNVPIAGNVKPVIKMEYDLSKDAKGMFISLGDAYKVKYVVSPNTYEMATTYGITIANKSASRSSYLSINKDNSGNVEGHIYEYTTFQDSDKIKACADFYVKDGYVSVVGNKSSGMIGFDGYVNELYSATEGRLLGYEVRETKTITVPVLGELKGTYNTLWLNLWDIDGVDSVKVTEKTNANESSRSTADVYLNGSSSLLVPTYNTKLKYKTSRKYDIELRTRFYYTYDSTNEKYVSNKVEVPMIFIQEGDNFDSFVSDFKSTNGIDVSVTINSAYLSKILSDYDTLIDVFIANKDKMSSEQIVSYLEQYE